MQCSMALINPFFNVFFQSKSLLIVIFGIHSNPFFVRFSCSDLILCYALVAVIFCYPFIRLVYWLTPLSELVEKHCLITTGHMLHHVGLM